LPLWFSFFFIGAYLHQFLHASIACTICKRSFFGGTTERRRKQNTLSNPHCVCPVHFILNISFLRVSADLREGCTFFLSLLPAVLRRSLGGVVRALKEFSSFFSWQHNRTQTHSHTHRREHRHESERDFLRKQQQKSK
jgi:hypothetical protein